MNRYTTALLLVALIGCSQDDSGDSSKACKVEGGSKPAIVWNMQGNIDIKGYNVAPNDLPELVKQWHITSAEIVGGQGAKFGDALKVQSELKDAGVQDVTIASHQDE